MKLYDLILASISKTFFSFLCRDEFIICLLLIFIQKAKANTEIVVYPGLPSVLEGSSLWKEDGMVSHSNQDNAFLTINMTQKTTHILVPLRHEKKIIQ